MAVPTDPARLSAVERTSMTQQVLQELREAIIDGRLAQGESLREVALSQSLGTGRSAVREAIRQLIQEGLVEHEVHRGAYVRVISLKDRLDVYFAREAIECGAVRRVIESPEPPDLSPLRAAIDTMRGVARGRERVSEQLIDADIHFHQAMVGLAGSPRLSRAHDTLAAETRMLLRHHPPYPWRDYVDDHVRLLETIEQRAPHTLDLVAEHLRYSARLIADALTAGESGLTHEEGSAR
jgi:DNA-binding GntR family transcriptional regulator